MTRKIIMALAVIGGLGALGVFLLRRRQATTTTSAGTPTILAGVTLPTTGDPTLLKKAS